MLPLPDMVVSPEPALKSPLIEMQPLRSEKLPLTMSAPPLISAEPPPEAKPPRTMSWADPIRSPEVEMEPPTVTSHRE